MGDIETALSEALTRYVQYHIDKERVEGDRRVAAQRERDAVIAEGWLHVHGWEPTQDVGRMIAAAIRARGTDDT